MSAVQIKISNTDRSSFVIYRSLVVKKQLNEKRDTCSFQVRKNSTFIPAYPNDVKVYDQTGSLIFGGTILKVKEEVESVGSEGIVYKVEASDYGYELDNILVSKTYTSTTINAIITDIVSGTSFDADNVDSTYGIEKIVFNQIKPTQAIQKLADIVNYHWYIDESKSIHFFPKFNKSAPFDLTDSSGNYVYRSLERVVDGSQLVNVVKVRGGRYNAESYTDYIKVSGGDTKSFKLPYKFANLQVWLDTGGGYVEQDVGIDFIDDFTNQDVLHNYQDQTIKWETSLSDGDKIKFSGNPKVRVFAIAEDSDSKSSYGEVQKLIRDNAIDSNTIARKRANAELYTYAEKLIDASFYTYETGLTTGQTINIQSSVRGSDNDLVIRTLPFKMIDPNNFGFNVELVSTKRFDLIDMLQKILQPESLDVDETEVSERIYADTASINVQETNQVVSPENDTASITINEDNQLNPIDPDNINWVWGYYFPISDTDTNRMAKWDRDSKWG